MPLVCSSRGRVRMAMVWNTKVRAKEMVAETPPLFRAVKKAEENTIPIMVFNPHPYEIEGDFECGFMLGGQNWNHDEFTYGTVYDESGKVIPTQNEQPDSSFELDWIKKVSFHGKLKPSSITRFDCKLNVGKRCESEFSDISDIITVKGKNTVVTISKKNGLIAGYEVNGKNYINDGGRFEVMKDNEDPWGMNVYSFKEKIGEFVLLSDEEANKFNGYPDCKVSNVRIVEDGEVRTKIQATFGYERSVALVEYLIPKNDSYMDIRIKLLSAEPNVMIKYRMDTAFNGTPFGESAFGMDEMATDETEAVFQKWCGIRNGEDALYIINSGTYGGSFGESTVKLSLLRTPVYSAHPIRDYPICPEHRNFDHIDIGEREFFFRITTAKDIFKQAQSFGEAPRVLSFFPSGDGKAQMPSVTVDNPNILLSSFMHIGDKYVLTLFNSSEKIEDAVVCVNGNDGEINVSLGKFEIKRIEVNV